MSKKIDIDFNLPFEIIRRPKWYVASCPVLDVHSQGETPEEAKAHLIEALTAFLSSCFAHGTFNEVLQECGISPSQIVSESSPPTSLSKKRYLRIPLPFSVKTVSPELCHV